MTKEEIVPKNNSGIYSRNQLEIAMDLYADQQNKELQKEVERQDRELKAVKKERKYYKETLINETKEAVKLLELSTQLKTKLEEANQELYKIKGIETTASTHRCAYCEDFYADEKNPLEKHNNDLCCESCKTDILDEENTDIKVELEESNKEVERLEESKKLLRTTALNIIKWIPDTHIVPKDRENLKFLVNDK